MAIRGWGHRRGGSSLPATLCLVMQLVKRGREGKPWRPYPVPGVSPEHAPP